MKQSTYLFLLVVIGASHVSFISMNQPELVKFDSSECLNEDVWEKKNILLNRILSSKIEDDSHTYKIFVVTNCSWASEGGIELKNDTLNLKYHGTRLNPRIIEENDSTIVEEYLTEVAACDCAFDLTYQIKGLENKPYAVTANGEVIVETPHKYRIVHDQPRFDIAENDTINYIDIYGLKQGLHLLYRRDGKLYGKIIFEDGLKVSGLISTYYNSQGYDRIEIHMANKEFTKKKYYLEGKLVKECDTLGDFDEGTNCVYFD